ncbi:hypothetical protein [Hyphomonas sp.]|uniref:hypothetical protein n=1 Tax=Hyphomonas sp. TaxID=87 RepID=UPI00352930F9
MSENMPYRTGAYLIEQVISCGWCDGELTAIVDVVSAEQNAGYTGPQVLKCQDVQYITFAEEAVADRADLFVAEESAKVFEGLSGLCVSSSSALLERLKRGRDFGEYVDFSARHYVVRAPYNSFEFVSPKTPILAGFHAD